MSGLVPCSKQKEAKGKFPAELPAFFICLAPPPLPLLSSPTPAEAPNPILQGSLAFSWLFLSLPLFAPQHELTLSLTASPSLSALQPFTTDVKNVGNSPGFSSPLHSPHVSLCSLFFCSPYSRMLIALFFYAFGFSSLALSHTFQAVTSNQSDAGG